MASTPEQLYEALQALPEADRLRLAERVIRDATQARAQGGQGEGRSVVGLWADEPEAVDTMLEGLLRDREERRLRLPAGALSKGS